MSKIDIHARHSMERAEAQQAADDLSRDLAEKFGIDYGWEGDTIHFERPGVQGQIDVTSDEIHIQAHLGFMLALLKTPIEDEVTRYLREHFGCQV
ncbi:MAG: polyhydroxyalkanoic acid system family protein [Pseudomonadota bacterium]